MFSKTKFFLTAIVLISFLVAVPLTASAQLNKEPLKGTELADSVLGCDTESEPSCIVESVLKFILAIAFFVAVVQVIISGYRLTMSQGNEEALTAAKRNLFWAFAGIIVITLSWAILTFIIDIVITGKQGKLVTMLM